MSRKKVSFTQSIARLMFVVPNLLRLGRNLTLLIKSEFKTTSINLIIALSLSLSLVMVALVSWINLLSILVVFLVSLHLTLLASLSLVFLINIILLGILAFILIKYKNKILNTFSSKKR